MNLCWVTKDKLLMWINM